MIKKLLMKKVCLESSIKHMGMCSTYPEIKTIALQKIFLLHNLPRPGRLSLLSAKQRYPNLTLANV